MSPDAGNRTLQSFADDAERLEHTLFVGREEELQRLLRLLRRGASGHGGVACIEGLPGMGKSTLLGALQEQARQIPEIQDAHFVTGYCDRETSSKNAYGPFAEILANLLTKPDTRRDLTKLVLKIIEKTGSDWLQIIPGVGPAIAAGVKTVPIVGQQVLGLEDDKQKNLANHLTLQYLNSITEIASHHSPLVLIIENAHWIDTTSCSLFQRLARIAHKHRLVLIMTYRQTHIDEKHPFYSDRSELISSGIAQRIELEGWSGAEIQNYVHSRFGGSLSPDLATWLFDLTNGHPLFVSQYLSLLEQAGIIRRVGDEFTLDGEISHSSGEWEVSGELAKLKPPDRVEEVLKQRIELLLEADRRMLEIGSVQGHRFVASILVNLVQERDLDVLNRLARVEQQHHIISYCAGDDWSRTWPDVYSFEHVLMQQQFYSRLSPPIRLRLHRSVAESLEATLKGQANPPRKLALEVAHHFDLAREPQRAARYYYRAAQSSFFADGAFSETRELCERALENARLLPEGVVEHDRLRARVIQLWLAASEIWWRGRPELQGELRLEILAEEAEAAARRAGDVALLAQVKHIKGKILVTTDNLARAVAMLQEALETAQQAGDALGQFAIMSTLGHQMVGENLAEGLKMLYRAHNLYQHGLAPTGSGLSRTSLDRHFSKLQGLIGVGEFDRGNYDAAVKWLNDSLAGLKRLKMREDLPWIFSFLAQVYTAIGQFELAEAVLREAIRLHTDEHEPNAVRAYNLGLLGKLYLEWLRVDEAAEPLLAGWRETEATWLVAVVPLVRNYYAELLMHPDYRARDLAEAERQLRATLEDTQQSGFHRSAIAALSLHSRLALLQRPADIESALDYSTQAIEYLERVGIMPALRTEEVLFNHSRALAAAGRMDEALEYLEQAREVLRQKAESIQDEERRRTFLERVPLNRAILAQEVR